MMQLSESAYILARYPSFMSRFAHSSLLSLHVSIKSSVRVTSSTQSIDGQQNLTLSNGEKLTADMYIPAFGLAPNSSYVPAEFLDDEGFVEVDEYLELKGAKGVWAIGDVSAREANQYAVARHQAFYVSRSIAFILQHKKPVPYEASTSK